MGLLSQDGENFEEERGNIRHLALSTHTIDKQQRDLGNLGA